MDKRISTGGVHHLKFTVTDVARSRAFYSEVLGFDVVKEHGSTVILSNGSVSIALAPPPFPERAIENDQFDENRVGLDHLALAVAGVHVLERAAKVLTERGMPHSDVVDMGSEFGFHVLVFRDPDNIQLELSAPHV
jgi:glyoxylase I family protein